MVGLRLDGSRAAAERGIRVLRLIHGRDARVAEAVGRARFGFIY